MFLLIDRETAFKDEKFHMDIGISGSPGSSVGRVSACSAGDPGLIPGSGTSPGEGNGSPL